MNKIFKYLGLGFLALALVVGVGAVQAQAALTLADLAITSDGALTLTSTDWVISSTGVMSGIDKITIGTTGASTQALKIHSHAMAAVADTVVANEFKGEFLNTGYTMDGIQATYRMTGTGTGVLRSIYGNATVGDASVTPAVTAILTGTLGTGSWVSGILGSADVSAGSEVSGTAVTVTGVYGGLGSMLGTLTQVNDMSAMWADSQATQVPSIGDSQLLLMTNSGTGGTVPILGSAIKIDGGGAGKITNFVTFDNTGTAAGSMAAAESANHYTLTNSDTPDGVIRVDIGGTPYWIPVYDAASVANE
jgi:hypothetical protein